MLSVSTIEKYNLYIVISKDFSCKCNRWSVDSICISFSLENTINEYICKTRIINSLNCFIFCVEDNEWSSRTSKDTRLINLTTEILTNVVGKEFLYCQWFLYGLGIFFLTPNWWCSKNNFVWYRCSINSICSFML